MIPAALPRRAKATFTALENAHASWAAMAARDHRSHAVQRASSQAFARLERTIYEALNTWGVPVEWASWGGAVLVGGEPWSSHEARAVVEAMFPGYKDRGNEIGDRVAAERRRKNGAKVRATIARNKSRRRS